MHGYFHEEATLCSQVCVWVGIFTLPSGFGRGLVHPAISPSYLCETEGVKSPVRRSAGFLGSL